MKKFDSCSASLRWFTVLMLSALAAGCGGGGGTQIFGTGGATNNSAPPDTTRPRVTVTVPATTAPGPTLNAPTNTAITAVFTENMAPATISGTSFTVTCVLPCVSPAGVVSYAVGSRTAVFTPAAVLAAGQTYTATVTTAATDLAANQLAGNQAALPAASNYVWTFTTAAPVPAANITVTTTKPIAAAVGVCPSATVNATFTVGSGLRMDPLTVNATTFTLTGPGLTPVAANTIALDVPTGTIATFTPAAPLTNGVMYTATVKGGAAGVKDLAVPGNQMLADFTWTFTGGPATGACLAPIALASASTFGDFGGSAGTTNQGILTIVNGDIGTTAASTLVTGFHHGLPAAGCTYTEPPLNNGTVNGGIFTAAPPPTVACPTDGTAATFLIAQNARADALAAYNALVALPGGPDPGAGNLANLTLAPGVYTAAAGTFKIQGGDLTLDAQGDANAVWVFQMATTLTVGGPGAAFPQSIILANGAQAKNVFWQVGSAATINAAGGGTMVGTIISQAGAAFSTAGNVAIVTLNGRALSLGASVTLVNTVINVPAP
jgi:Ice-binding-like/Bacterial Ig-like domain